MRGSYRVDHCLINRKWWWLLVFWIIGFFPTNAYVLYCKTCDEHEIPKQGFLTHIEFRKSVSLAWINTELHAE